jgi:hypothetical protein
MKNTNHDTRSSSTSAKSCEQQPSAPTSGASVEYNDLFGAPAFGSDDSGSNGPGPDRDTDQSRQAETKSVQYSDLFGAPALASGPDRGQGPPSPPPLHENVSEAEESLYRAAFRVGCKRPGHLMQAFRIVRKGLQRGKEVAEGRGAHRE